MTETGGCFCGAVRYRLNAAPTHTTNCHCRMCQQTSGAPYVTWTSVPRSAFELLSGAPRTFKSSSFAERWFCGQCGTPLVFLSDRHPQELDVTVASLDRPDRHAPQREIHGESQLPWVKSDLAAEP
ncbi:MAG: GFA family protein [Pseudomonadota bacterium]